MTETIDPGSFCLHERSSVPKRSLAFPPASTSWRWALSQLVGGRVAVHLMTFSSQHKIATPLQVELGVLFFWECIGFELISCGLNCNVIFSRQNWPCHNPSKLTNLAVFLTGTLHDLSFHGTFLTQGKAAASADFIKDKAKWGLSQWFFGLCRFAQLAMWADMISRLNIFLNLPSLSMLGTRSLKWAAVSKIHSSHLLMCIDAGICCPSPCGGQECLKMTKLNKANAVASWQRQTKGCLLAMLIKPRVVIHHSWAVATEDACWCAQVEEFQFCSCLWLNHKGFPMYSKGTVPCSDLSLGCNVQS